MIIYPLHPSQFTALKTKLEDTHQAEITIEHSEIPTGDIRGTIAGHGVSANFQYNGTTQTLSVDVTHHPFFIPVSAIESQLRSAIAGLQ